MALTKNNTMRALLHVRWPPEGNRHLGVQRAQRAQQAQRTTVCNVRTTVCNVRRQPPALRTSRLQSFHRRLAPQSVFSLFLFQSVYLFVVLLLHIKCFLVTVNSTHVCQTVSHIVICLGPCLFAPSFASSFDQSSHSKERIACYINMHIEGQIPQNNLGMGHSHPLGNDK